MPLISHVDRVDALFINPPFGAGRMLTIAAIGLAPTTGWTHGRLSPAVYVKPPADGVWDFDFLADAPIGIVAEVLTPISAAWFGFAPDWCKGVRVHAADNQVAVAAELAEKLATLARPGAGIGGAALKGGRAIFNQTLASYDDSFQPTGTIHWSGGFPPVPHIEMKKLHHELVLTAEGPDDAKIRDCLAKATAAGLIAAIAAAFASGGLGLQAALSAFLSALLGCLGDAYTARIDDQSHWIYWDT